MFTDGMLDFHDFQERQERQVSPGVFRCARNCLRQGVDARVLQKFPWLVQEIVFKLRLDTGCPGWPGKQGLARRGDQEDQEENKEAAGGRVGGRVDGLGLCCRVPGPDVVSARGVVGVPCGCCCGCCSVWVMSGFVSWCASGV